MAETYFIINEDLETSSGITLNGVYIHVDIYTNKLISQAIISMDVPSYANLQALNDNSDKVFFRKKGTLEKVGGISNYQLTPQQAADLMNINEWTNVVKDVLSDVYAIDRANIQVTTV